MAFFSKLSKSTNSDIFRYSGLYKSFKSSKSTWNEANQGKGRLRALFGNQLWSNPQFCTFPVVNGGYLYLSVGRRKDINVSECLLQKVSHMSQMITGLSKSLKKFIFLRSDASVTTLNRLYLVMRGKRDLHIVSIIPIFLNRVDHGVPQTGTCYMLYNYDSWGSHSQTLSLKPFIINFKPWFLVIHSPKTSMT